MTTEEHRQHRVAQFTTLREQGLTYREIGEQFGISRERVRQVLEPIMFAPEALRQAQQERRDSKRPPKPVRTPRSNKAWQRRVMRQYHDFRQTHVDELRALAAALGRNPTTKEVTRHFNKNWQTIARYFVGRNSTSNGYSRGYHRWFKLAGLSPKTRGRKMLAVVPDMTVVWAGDEIEKAPL